MTELDHDLPPELLSLLLADFRLWQGADNLHAPPWVVDPSVPVGGEYWVSRVFLFKRVVAKVESYQESVARASAKAAGKA